MLPGSRARVVRPACGAYGWRMKLDFRKVLPVKSGMSNPVRSALVPNPGERPEHASPTQGFLVDVRFLLEAYGFDWVYLLASSRSCCSIHFPLFGRHCAAHPVAVEQVFVTWPCYSRCRRDLCGMTRGNQMALVPSIPSISSLIWRLLMPCHSRKVQHTCPVRIVYGGQSGKVVPKTSRVYFRQERPRTYLLALPSIIDTEMRSCKIMNFWPHHTIVFCPPSPYRPSWLGRRQHITCHHYTHFLDIARFYQPPLLSRGIEQPKRRR